MKFSKYILFLILIICYACTNTTTLDSKNITDKSKRIEKLKPEIKVFSEILDAEFELFNANGFSNNFFSIPGSSSRDYKFIIKVKNTDIPAWTKDLKRVSNSSYENRKTIISLTETRKNNWITISEPIVYKRENEDNVIIIVFEKEGIIYKHIQQL